MKPLPRALTLISACLLLTSATAEETPSDVRARRAAPTDAAEVNPILASPAAAADRSAQPRPISPETAAHLAVAAPKYVPPEELVASATAEPVEDRPRNTIIRLPSYIVRDRRLPPLNQTQTLTPEGRRTFELKKHPGLWLTDSRFFYSWAREMYEDEQVGERRKQMADWLSLLPVGARTDKSTALLIETATTRPTTWVETGGSYQQQRR